MMETIAKTSGITSGNPETMTAARIEAPGKIRFTDVPLPQPKPGQIRIKIQGCGLCASSIPLWEGREWFEYPSPAGNPGHECWGTVDAIGQGVHQLLPGQRIAGLSYNGYADYDLADAGEVVALPPFLDGKPFPGEPLGCAVNIFNRSDIRPGHTVAIVGAGFLGHLLIQLAKSAGATVIAISQREFSLSAAKMAGADYTMALDDHYVVIDKIREITNGRLCERVIEATGKEWPLNLSIELTTERGKLIVAGFHQDGMRQVNMQLLNWRGIDVISAHERDPQRYVTGMKQAIEAIRDGRMDPFPFFTHEFPLEALGLAFGHLASRPDGFIKALIINQPI